MAVGVNDDIPTIGDQMDEQNKANAASDSGGASPGATTQSATSGPTQNGTAISTNSGVGSAITSSGTPGSPGAPSQASSGAQGSGRYTNLQKYVNANQGASQDLTNKITNNIQQAGTNFQNNLGQAQNLFNANSAGNFGNVSNLGLVNDAANNATNYLPTAADTSSTSAAPADRSTVAAAPTTNYGQVQNVLNADTVYSNNAARDLNDLNGAANYGNLAAGAKDVSDLSSNAQSENGRYALLRGMFGNSGYTTGEQNLDNLLLQGNQASLKSLGGVQAIGATANQNLNNAQTNAQNLYASNVQKAGNVAQQAGSTLNNSLANIPLAVQAKLAADTTAQSNALAAAQSALNNNQMSAADQARFGINAGTNLYTGSAYTQNLGNLFTAGAAPTVQGEITAPQYQNLMALSKILGNKVSQDNSGATSLYTDPTGQTAYDPNSAYTLNTQNFQQNQADAAAKYNTWLQGNYGQEAQRDLSVIKANDPTGMYSDLYNNPNVLQLIANYGTGALGANQANGVGGFDPNSGPQALESLENNVYTLQHTPNQIDPNSVRAAYGPLDQQLYQNLVDSMNKNALQTIGQGTYYNTPPMGFEGSASNPVNGLTVNPAPAAAAAANGQLPDSVINSIIGPRRSY